MKLDLLEQGGWVFAAIALLSVGGWSLIAWKYLMVRDQFRCGFEWAQTVVLHLRNSDRERAVAVCRDQSSFLARVLTPVLEYPRRQLSFETQLLPLVQGESMILRRHLSSIAVIGSLAPLLGLLGTVLGMMQSFSMLTVSSGVSRLADGVSQALITTQAGLLVALPILLLHRYLASRIQQCVDLGELYARKVHTAIAEGAC